MSAFDCWAVTFSQMFAEYFRATSDDAGGQIQCVSQ